MKKKSFKKWLTTNCTIKTQNFGYITSHWSLEKIKKPCDPLNVLVKDLIRIKTNFNNLKYRTEVCDVIKQDVKNNIINPNKKINTSIDKLCGKICGNIENGPYARLTKIVEKLDCIQSDNLAEALKYIINPYIIGGESDQILDGYSDILTTDQVNLIAMCYLAKKLRLSNGQSPKIPAVWWFDLALDNKLYCKLNYASISEYCKISTLRFDDIINDAKSADNLADCLKRFCFETGFSLAFKYPIVNSLCICKPQQNVGRTYVFSESKPLKYDAEILGKDGVQFYDFAVSYDVKKLKLSRKIKKIKTMLTYDCKTISKEQEYVFGKDFLLRAIENNNVTCRYMLELK